MNVVIVANDSYVQHAAVMLTSLFEANKKSHFHVFLLTDGVSDENKSRLERLCTVYNNIIEIHLPEQELLQESNINIEKLNSGKWSKMIYYKLFMPRILPHEIDRCLFLDVDMVVVDNVDSLYNIRMGEDIIIAAVEDVVSCIPRKKILGLDSSDPYINSGVMVCDIDRWRKEEKIRPIFNFVLNWSDKIINEQDVIALYMRNHIQLLPIRWNMVGCNYLRKRYVFPRYYSELREARKHPAIHHFCTLIPPWYADSPHPYRGLYKKYLKKYGKMIGVHVSLRFPYKNAPKNIIQRFRHFIADILNFFNIIRQPGYVLHRLKY